MRHDGNDAERRGVAAGVSDVRPYRSPSLDRPGAVPAPEGSLDEGVPWHYGDPHGEQRALAAGAGAVDLSHRAVVRIGGADRLGWLHSITTQSVADLPAPSSATALVLSPHGHVEHELHLIEDGASTWLITDPSTVTGLLGYLEAMRFLLRVDIEDATAGFAVVGEAAASPHATLASWVSPVQFASEQTTDADEAKYVPRRPATWAVREVLVPRSGLTHYLDTVEGPLAGTWAWEALRVAAAVPRVGVDTDHRTIPHEVGLVPAAVHLHKGCYRGQETVARVHNLGRPPRRLVLLHLDGSDSRVTVTGDPVELDGKVVGTVMSVALHHELGPVALALVKRSTPPTAALSAGGVAAGQQTVVVA